MNYNFKKLFLKNSEGLNGQSVNFICIEDVKSLRHEIMQQNVTFIGSHELYHHVLYTFKALVPFFKEQQKANEIANQLQYEPDLFIADTIISFIIEEWDQVGSLSYTMRLLADFCEIYDINE